jgi:hypothetical protein
MTEMDRYAQEPEQNAEGDPMPPVVAEVLEFARQNAIIGLHTEANIVTDIGGEQQSPMVSGFSYIGVGATAEGIDRLSAWAQFKGRYSPAGAIYGQDNGVVEGIAFSPVFTRTNERVQDGFETVTEVTGSRPMYERRAVGILGAFGMQHQDVYVGEEPVTEEKQVPIYKIVPKVTRATVVDPSSGEAEPGTELCYTFRHDPEGSVAYLDDLGRPGASLVVAIVLPETTAREMRTFLEQQPHMMRAVAGQILQRQHPSLFEARGHKNEYQPDATRQVGLRPPYETLPTDWRIGMATKETGEDEYTIVKLP